MTDSFEISIWSRNYDDTFDKQVARVYNSLLEMSNIENLAPKYLKSISKESALSFGLTNDNVAELIEKNTDEKKPHLGARIGFFTSKDDDKMCGIRISTGIKNPIFVNSITIDLSSMNLHNDEIKRNQIIQLFNKLIQINDAFYACIVDYTNYQLYDGLYEHKTKLPKSVFWVNYWGEEIIDRITLKGVAIDNLRNKVYQIKKQQNGYFIRLTETAVFDEKRKIALQKQVNKQLGL